MTSRRFRLSPLSLARPPTMLPRPHPLGSGRFRPSPPHPTTPPPPPPPRFSSVTPPPPPPPPPPKGPANSSGPPSSGENRVLQSIKTFLSVLLADYVIAEYARIRMRHDQERSDKEKGKIRAKQHTEILTRLDTIALNVKALVDIQVSGVATAYCTPLEFVQGPGRKGPPAPAADAAAPAAKKAPAPAAQPAAQPAPAPG